MKNKTTKVIEAVFYKASSGRIPALEEIKKLSTNDKKVVGGDLFTVETGFPIGLPVCRPLGNGLWEVRSSLKGRIFRVIFSVDGADMVLLHAFVKKTQKTPKSDLDLARARWTKYLNQKEK